MNEPQELSVLLKELRDPFPLASNAEVESQRRQLLPLLRERVRAFPELVQRRRRRQRYQAVFGSLLMAAAVAVVVGVSTQASVPTATHDGNSQSDEQASSVQIEPRHGKVELLSASGKRTVLNEKDTVSASGELSVVESAQLTTSQGIAIDLGAGTRVGLDGLATKRGASRLNLVSGSVHCAVPPLGSNQFSVSTGSTQIVVHGTAFSVAVTKTGTCVRVSEGKVEVRDQGQSQFLTAGQDWGCDVAPEPPKEEGSEERDQTTRPARARVRSAAASRAAAEPEQEAASDAPAITGTLASETRLIAQALSAEHAGQPKRAKRLYQQLLEKYPQSPLALDARRGVARLDD